jgi:hypothetical protein
LQDWALSHLKYYEDIWKKYHKILNCQDNFNIEIKKFLESYKEYLTNLVEADSIRDKDKIELFLRYYLFKIVDEFQHPKSNEYRLTHFDKETFNGVVIENPFPENEEIIIKDIIGRYSDLANQIKDFENDIKKLNELILDFQVSLRFVIDNSVTGLKGSCPKEKQLSYRNGFISFL